MKLSRRHFLVTAGAVTLGFTGLHRLMAEGSGIVVTGTTAGFGPLVADPANIFDLPKGFSYKIIGRRGEPMSDGFFTPAAPDGMGTFPTADGKTVIVRNHELDPEDVAVGPFGPGSELFALLPAGMAYDPARGNASPGGTTNILFNTKLQQVERVELSLAGTLRNCAGGVTPWGTWVTCEETVARADAALEQDHGYNFEVPGRMGLLADPVPLRAMGRFNHEAIAVDPRSGIVYQTEDRNDGLIYRFIPTTPGDLKAGGKLQALKVREQPSLDTRNWTTPRGIKPGQAFDVEWIDMEEIDAPEDDLRARGFAAGAAQFARGEGMWYGNDAVYFACTNGGDAKKGQIWRYVPSPEEGQSGELTQPGRLELFIEPNDGAIIENADNLCVAPWGDLIVCEDGSGTQFLVGVTPRGEVYKFARNARSQSELAGACFSPDGSTLFVNIQGDGLTLAITGPWKG